MNLKYISKLLNYLDENYINILKAIDECGYINENKKEINFMNNNQFEEKQISFFNKSIIFNKIILIIIIKKSRLI